MNKKLSQLIYSDLYRIAAKKSRRDLVFETATNPGFRYIALMRRAAYYSGISSMKLLHFYYKFRLRTNSHKYGFQIPSEVKIGKGFYIGHFGRIIINPDSILGDNCNIATGVTIGQTNRGVKMGSPIIGNEVWIGANAVIVGKVRIGNNVLIAPNSYVNFDVPDNSVVIGNPANTISRMDATQGYINFKA